MSNGLFTGYHMNQYSLLDAKQRLDSISDIAIFVHSNACPQDIRFKLIDHLQDEIETLQFMLSFMHYCESRTVSP